MSRSIPKPASPFDPVTPAPVPGEINQGVYGAPGPNHEQIARRAYELFEARGRQHGHHLEDWLQAERELRLGRR